MAKKYYSWKKPANEKQATDSDNTLTDKPVKENKDDPRVRAFVRSFAPSVSQIDEDTECLSIIDLRKFFNAYIALQSGFDPLVKILNQLEEHGFTLEVDDYKNEMVLPCRRIIRNAIPISYE